MLRIIKWLFLSLVAIVLLLIATFMGLRKTIPDRVAPENIQTAVASPDHGEAITKSRERMVEARRDDFYPSLSVSVYYEGELLWSEALGVTDLSQLTPATGDTVYPIGSISKSLTATLAMKLVAAGLLDLDKPIHDYAPSLPDHYRGVTMRHLLSHQAGVRHYKFAFTPPSFTENGLNKEFASSEDSLEIFIDDPLLFTPDEGFQYSTFGYTLVSYVMEQAAGMSFLDLMRENILAPLSLNKITADKADPIPENRTKDYMAMMRKLGILPSPPTNSSYKWAGGGFVSTTRDIAAFGDALINQEFLSEGAFTEMTSPRTTADGEINPQYYGLGWRSGTMTYPSGSDGETPIIHHGGTAAGAQCMLVLAPDLGVSTAVCGNAFTGGSGNLLPLAARIGRDFVEATIAEQN